MYEAWTWTVSNLTALNRSTQSQTKTCIAQSSCVFKREQNMTKDNWTRCLKPFRMFVNCFPALNVCISYMNLQWYSL